jgi:hypothetical protein
MLTFLLQSSRLAAFLAALFTLTFAASARAQTGSAAPPAGPPPPLAPSPVTTPATAAPADGSCFPVCRDGFVCSQSRCISLCNPPCAPDQFCIEGRRCDHAPQSAIHEPPPPPPVSFAERSFSMLAFHYGFSSTVDVAGEDGPSGPVLGVNARTDLPIAKYILVGPMLEFAVTEPSYYLDLDVALRVRIPIEVEKIQLQLWGGMPIGLTFSFLKDDFAHSFTPDLDAFALGWNIGVLFGGAVHFSRDFGLFTELGWQQHTMSHGRELNGSVELVLDPWIWNVGFVFRG